MVEEGKRADGEMPGGPGGEARGSPGGGTRRRPDGAGRADPNAAFAASLGRLAAAERRAVLRGAIGGVSAAAMAALSAILALQAILPDWRPLPLASFVLFWGLLAAAAWRTALRPIAGLGGLDRLAAGLDARAGGRGGIAAALEFSRGGERLAGYSPYLVAEAVRRAAGRLDALDARELFAPAGRPAWAAIGILSGLILIAQVTAGEADLGRALRGVADAGLYFRDGTGSNLVVLSGDRRILSGEDVLAEAANFGAKRSKVTLRVSTVPGVWTRLPVDRDTMLIGKRPVALYRHRFAGVREGFSYAFEAAGVRTPSRTVTVLRRPVINNIRAILRFPPYTAARPETIQTLAGRIAALKGTVVELLGETSASIAPAGAPPGAAEAETTEAASGRLVFSSGAIVPCAAAEGGFRASFTVSADDTFVVEIKDAAGLANEGAVRYPVSALDDRPPVIELVAPDDNAQIPRSLEVELLFRASDDYGISRAAVHFLREGKEDRFAAEPVPLPRGDAGPEVEARHSWSLAEAGLFPGDRILYYVEVVDNNTATGPGIARSETRRLAVPSLADIYARIHEEESRRSETLEGARDEGREIRERLRKLSDELKADGKLDWAKKRESGEIVEKTREIQERIAETARELDRALDDIEKNRTASQEVGRKLEEIQDLLGRIESRELREVIDKLRSLLGEVPQNELMAQMRELEADADKLVESMDRTIELLKQVLREEKVEELVRRLGSLLDGQRELRDSTAAGDREDLAERQGSLGEDSDRLSDDMERFKRQEADSALASELAKMLEKMSRDSIGERMRDASKQIAGGRRDEAQRTQSEVVNDLLSLYTQLGACQNSMGMAMDREVRERIGRATKELIAISESQERLVAAGAAAQGRPPDRASLLRDQVIVREAVRAVTDGLAEVGGKSMAISPAVFFRLDEAAAEIDRALAMLQSENYAGVAAGAARAYRSMNLAAIELLRSSVAAGASSGSARGMMQQMLEEQLSISRQLERLLGQRAGEWSEEERAGMARLAAEQRRLEEVMKQIAEESGGSGERLGRVDDIAGEMEEIAKALEEGRLTSDVLDRQERILTRLLESARSLRERDYKRERESAAAGDVPALGPDRPPGAASERELLLRMIRRGMQEKGPAEYEELIRQYFRALSRKAREGEGR